FRVATGGVYKGQGRNQRVTNTFCTGVHFRSDADPPLLEKYNVVPSRPSPPMTYVREHTYRVTSA
ncbi:hypothetical protein WUBG_15866, partial [Wuchereria bancrofti]